MYTNIQQPRAWQGGNGCIAADVGPISHKYFNEQLTDFREFMSEADIPEIDKGWSSLCFQYESLESDPMGTITQVRFEALMDEWSLRKRLMISGANNVLKAGAISYNHFNIVSSLHRK